MAPNTLAYSAPPSVTNTKVSICQQSLKASRKRVRVIWPTFIWPTFIWPTYIRPTFIWPTFIWLNFIWPNFIWPNFIWPNFIRQTFIWQTFIWQTFIWPTFIWPTFIWLTFIWPTFIWPTFIWPNFIWPTFILPAFIWSTFIWSTNRLVNWSTVSQMKGKCCVEQTLLLPSDYWLNTWNFYQKTYVKKSNKDLGKNEMSWNSRKGITSFGQLSFGQHRNENRLYHWSTFVQKPNVCCQMLFVQNACLSNALAPET